jgi:hypothetical protein
VLAFYLQAPWNDKRLAAMLAAESDDELFNNLALLKHLGEHGKTQLKLIELKKQSKIPKLSARKSNRKQTTANQPFV